MKPNYIYLLIFGLVLNVNTIFAQPKDVISAIKEECDRNLNQLRIDKLQSPFFISYAIVESDFLNVSASFGALTSSQMFSQKMGYPTILVGNYQHNNLNFINREEHYGWYSYASRLPLGDEPVGIRTTIWQDLDSRYKKAAENYETKQAIMRQSQLKEEDLNLNDFEKREPVNIYLDPVKVNRDKSYWENYARKSSEIVKKYPEIIKSNIIIQVIDKNTYYYNTENSQYFIPTPYYQIEFSLSALTADGQEISDQLYVECTSFEQLPDLNSFIKIGEDFISYFLELRNAPLIEDSYSGPVMIEEMALAEAFQTHFFRPSLIAKRSSIVSDDAKRSNISGSGNNQELMMNKKIISRSLSVKSLTGTEYFEGKKLDGYVPVDAEAVVPDKELVLVENGVLKNMLNRRIPTKKIKGSNGHAQYEGNQTKIKTVPGNLQLLSNDTYSKEELKKKLMDAAKEEDLDYAYIVRRLRGNNIIAIYKVYVQDGREELQRGASLPDFNMKSFKRVLGAVDKNYFYNTTAFGSLVTFIVPEALLFEELEVTKNNNITFKTPFVIPQPLEAKK